MLALDLNFHKLCVEVSLLFAKDGIVALFKCGTITDDSENDESPSSYSLLLKYLPVTVPCSIGTMTHIAL